MLYITHDLLSARLLADEILVLHEGPWSSRSGPDVIRDARDDYTRRLLDAIPNPFKDLPDYSPNGSRDRLTGTRRRTAAEGRRQPRGVRSARPRSRPAGATRGRRW